MSHAKIGAAPRGSGATPEAGLSDGQRLGRFNARRDDSAEAAFAALVRRHGPMVLRVCGQVLGDAHGAEDAFQASFLVLARRSGSIGRPELLGNWLHGVALRTAKEAKMRDGRRRRLEAPAGGLGRGGPAVDDARPESSLIGREELEALHEEVARLPERYRIPVVLCELEGLSYQEAARRMRCPVGTIGVRLARARERLRGRLIRRGIAPAAALARVMLGSGHASALMPAVLVDATVRAASGLAAGDAAASGLASAAVVALAESVLRAMKVAMLQVAAGAALVAGLAASIWVGGRRTDPAPAAPDRAATRPPDAAPAFAAVADAEPSPTAPIAVAQPASQVSADEGVRPGPIVALASFQKESRAEQARGEALFFKEWVAHDPASPRGDGLGPVFNETSCVACHGLGAPGGAGPENKNVVILTSVSDNGGRTPKGLERIHPGFRDSRSAVLHRHGTDPGYQVWRAGFLNPQPRQAQASQVPRAEGGEEKLEARISQVVVLAARNGRGRPRLPRLSPEPGITLRVSERNTPALFGAGRIDAIPAEVLIEEARSQAAEVRGRVNRTRDGRVGRFGWKAQIGGLHEFVRGACASELGLEVAGHSQPASPLAPAEKAKGVDMSQAECDALVAFVRALPAPVVVDPDGPRGNRDMAEGRRLFAAVGCASCHAPSLGDVRGIYSDLLLHDLGQGLGDSGSSYGIEGPESPGDPSPGEWRTPPLWGYRDSGPYLHDGRAETLEEAVALHGGQGGPSARGFFSLPPEDRSRVESFLKSLVAPADAAPGLVLAAELEARIQPDRARQAEALVRKQREEAEAREVADRAEERRRQLVLAAEKRAPGHFQIAANLERSGKITGALEFYRLVVRDAPNTGEAKAAAGRIAALVKRPPSP